MTVNLLKGPALPLPPAPNTHRKESKIASVTSVYFKSGGGDFRRNAAEMFSFDPNPTTAQEKPSPLLLVYFMLSPKHTLRSLLMSVS